MKVAFLLSFWLIKVGAIYSTSFKQGFHRLIAKIYYIVVRENKRK